MNVRPGRLSVVTTVLGVTAALLTGSPASAAPRLHITWQQANEALPTSESLPGHVTTSWALTRLVDQPCLLSGDKIVTVTLPKGTDGGTRTASSSGGQIATRTLVWHVEILALPSTAAVTSYLARFRAAERACPATASYPYERTKAGLLAVHSHKLAFSRTSHAGWTGFHGVDRLTYDGPGKVERRLWTLLGRGNALVLVSVTDEARAVSGLHEEQWRQSVQDRVSAALSRLAG